MRWSLRQINQCLLSVSMLLSVSACLSISSESPALPLYRLTAAEVQSAADVPTLAIAISSNSSRLLDGQRLWVMQADRRVQPLADFRWAMPVPELFRQALIETLEASGVAVAVHTPASNERLQLELRALQLELDPAGQAQAHIAVLASWSGKNDAHANQLFEVRRDAVITSADRAAAAMDQASRQLLVELSGWLQDQSRQHQSRR